MTNFKKTQLFFLTFTRVSYIAHAQSFIAMPKQTAGPQSGGAVEFSVAKAATETAEAGVYSYWRPVSAWQRIWGWLSERRSRTPLPAGTAGVYIARIQCYGVRYIAISSLPKSRPMADTLLRYSGGLGSSTCPSIRPERLHARVPGSGKERETHFV